MNKKEIIKELELIEIYLTDGADITALDRLQKLIKEIKKEVIKNGRYSKT